MDRHHTHTTKAGSMTPVICTTIAAAAYVFGQLLRASGQVQAARQYGPQADPCEESEDYIHTADIPEPICDYMDEFAPHDHIGDWTIEPSHEGDWRHSHIYPYGENQHLIDEDGNCACQPATIPMPHMEEIIYIYHHHQLTNH